MSPGSSELSRLVRSIRRVLASEATDFRLEGQHISVEPILNWGGFVNRSFRVSDSRSSFFLKLASDRQVQRGLEQWRELAPILEHRYHAPRMVGWLEIEDPSVCGPVFDWVVGRPLRDLSGERGRQLIEVVSRLHVDEELADRLIVADAGPPTCMDRYLRTYHERFVEDLAAIESAVPPFLDEADVRWMRLQVGELERRVRESAAFQERADCPVHGDLWLNNTLAHPSGSWYILDWDDLGRGDPVADWAMLFGPSRQHVRPAEIHATPGQVTLAAKERERLAIYARASLLDWVIDPLADWVQAGEEPEQGPLLRQANESVHLQAMRAYRNRFGD